MKKKEIKSYNLEELGLIFESLGEKKFRSKQVYEWIHQKGVVSFDEMTNVSRQLREKLSEEYEIRPVTMVEQRTSQKDGTSKFLFRLWDGKVIESVLMKYSHGNSVCISSQVGCRMGCKFCASTIGGLERNLEPAEMLSQIYEIQRISKERVSNVVVMGTGEPFDNFENLCKFIEMLTDENGLHISQRNVVVSTCGLVPKIYELADRQFQITLAISLHAPNDEIRQELMPIAKKYSIVEIMKACLYYYNKTGRRFTFEYSLCDGINDSEENAKALSRLVKGMNCHINLIPINPIKERKFKHSNLSNIQKFKLILEKNRINVTIRREMGSDIDAACGQLRKSYIDTIN
ncbi:MAG: 23S rRNA (adenine(2503)-C(2))-methyltransferase RlmN [Velocimicrobium sp.]